MFRGLELVRKELGFLGVVEELKVYKKRKYIRKEDKREMGEMRFLDIFSGYNL